MWAWLKAFWKCEPEPMPEPAEWVDPAPLEDHDEGTVRCSCLAWKSRHGGVMICFDCDLIAFMPGGEHELTRLETVEDDE